MLDLKHINVISIEVDWTSFNLCLFCATFAIVFKPCCYVQHIKTGILTADVTYFNTNGLLPL